MMLRTALMLLAFASLSVASAQQQEHESGSNDQKGHRMGEEGAHGAMQMSRARHHFARDNGVGEIYEGEVSPLLAADVDMDAAKALFDRNCAGCHGEKGLGDGVDGSALDPKPTNIARFAKMGMARDDYLLWTLAEGGQPIESDMPAFKDLLSRDEIWQIVAYLRQLQAQ